MMLIYCYKLSLYITYLQTSSIVCIGIVQNRKVKTKIKLSEFLRGVNVLRENNGTSDTIKTRIHARRQYKE